MYGSWKLARVSPIFKKDDPTGPGNYPPVSLLSVPSKLLESEINTVIVNLVTSNNLITLNQWDSGLTEKVTPLNYFLSILQRNGEGLLIADSKSLLHS